MIAVAYRLGSALRRRWLGTLGLIAVIAVICVVPFAVASGAQRTMSAPDRYTATYGRAFQGTVTQEEGGRPRTAEITALPGIASVDAFTFVFGGLIPTGATDLANVLVFAGSYSPGSRLVAGRDPSATAAGEFVATRSFIQANSTSLGDVFELITLTQEQGDTNGFAVDQPAGPRVAATLVGVVDGPSGLDDATPYAYFSPALLDVPDIGVSQTKFSVSVRPGVTLDELRAQLDALIDSQALTLEPGALVSPTIRRAVEAQSRGLWILAVVAAIATVAVLGQVVARQVRLTPGERERLVAIGFTHRQVLAESIGRAAVPVVVGALAGATLAVLPSALFPFGFARRVEPHVGARIDVAVLGAALAIIVVGLLLWVVGSVLLGRSTRRSIRSSAIIDAVATKAPTPAAANGLRFAFGRRVNDRSSVAASIAGVLLTVAGIVGALVFGTSLNRLVRDPERFGSNYDFVVGAQGADALAPEAQSALVADTDIDALTLFAIDHARVGPTTVPLLGMQALRGEATPELLEGRLPVGDDEIAFGRLAAADVRTRIGSTVVLTGPQGAQSYRVTGLVVVPGLGPNDGLGAGAVMTYRGLTRLNPDASFTAAGVRLANHRPDAVARLTEIGGAPPDGPFRPSAIINVARVRVIPFVIAFFLGTLALLTVGHAILTSLRSRRRDVAVLRALGADRALVTRVMHWQATLFTTVAAAIGVPVGLIAGRFVFRAFADSMGARREASVPVLLSLAALVALVAFANVAATVPARRARRSRPADALRAE